MPATTKAAKPAKATKNAKALKANPAKPAEPQPQAVAEAKPSKPVVAEKDALGCRLKSQSATINAQLSTTKPKTALEISTATSINAGRCRAHLAYLVGKDLAKATDDGYVLVKAK